MDPPCSLVRVGEWNIHRRSQSVARTLYDSSRKFLIDRRPRLLRLIPSVRYEKFRLRQTIVMPRRQGIRLTTSHRNAINNAFLFLSIIPDMYHTRFIRDILYLTTITAPYNAMSISNRVESFLYSTTLSFCTIRCRAMFVMAKVL